MKVEPNPDLQSLLCDHAAIDTPEDRLHAVLKQSAKPGKPNTVKPRALRLSHTLWLTGIAASFAGGIVFFQAPKSPSNVPVQQAALALANAAKSSAAIELAELMANSRMLERNLQTIGNSRARISQLQSLQHASAALATLDSQLDYWVNAKPDDLDKQCALWRERVTVMHAVENGEFHPALFLVD